MMIPIRWCVLRHRGRRAGVGGVVVGDGLALQKKPLEV